MTLRNRLRNLLLDNKSTKQTIFKNAFWLFAGRGFGFLELLLIILVARILGPTDYGKFSFAWSVVSMLAAVAVFGVPEMITREFSRKEELSKELPSILSLRSILSLVAFLLMFGLSFLLTADQQVRTVIWLLAAYVLLRGFGETLFAVFRARQRMEYQAWMQVFLTACLFVSVGLALLFYPSITYISFGYFAGALLGLVGVLVFFSLRVRVLRIGWDKKVWRKFLSFSWPLGLTAVFSSVHMYADSVIMGVLGQTTQVGWYNAAYRIANITLIPMTIISLSFYPVLSQRYIESKDRFQEAWTHFLRIMVALATPIVVGVLILAPEIVNFVYGKEYAPSVLALRILMVMVGFWFISTPLIRALVVANYQRVVLLGSVIVAPINVYLNLLLIPRYSLDGAAVATVLTYIIGFLIALFFMVKYIGLRIFSPNFLKSVISIFGSAALMGIFLFSLREYLNVLVVIAGGGVIYGAALILSLKAAKVLE